MAVLTGSIAVYLLAFLILVYSVQRIEEKDIRSSKIQRDKNRNLTTSVMVSLCVILGASFIFHSICAYSVRGHGTDMNCFMAWASKMSGEGPAHFYEEGYFADYPPGYMYILGLLGGIIKLFGAGEQATWLIIKMPSIICDILLALFVFKLSYKSFGSKIALILTAIIAFNPMMYIDSAVWGQVESILTLFLVISLYNVYKEKYYMGVMWFIFALLIKPQALMAAPVYLFAYLETKNPKLILKSILLGIAVFIAFCIPFSPVWQNGGNAAASFFKSFNPVWVFDKYFGTMQSYKYVSVNAFNLHAVFGGNWKPLNSFFTVLGYIITIGSMVASGFVYFRLKDRWAKIFGTAFFLISVLFAFNTSMHERYLYVAVIFLFMLFLSTKNRRGLLLFGGLSATSALNILYVLYCNTNNNMMPKSAVVIPISLFTVTFIVLSIVHLYRTRGARSAEIETAKSKSAVPAASVKNNEKRRVPLDERLLGIFKGNNRDVWKNIRLVRIDYIIISAIVVLYSCAAFINLGDIKAPQTFFKPESADDAFIVEFESPAEVSSIRYYCGIGDVGKSPAVNLSFSTDGDNWIDSAESCQLKSVFKWEKFDLSVPIAAKFALGSFSNTEIRVGEIGFFDEYGNQISVRNVFGRYSGDYSAVADEQDCVPLKNSYRNSTYFDEIYHPRTAYEHLHSMPYYETTHPPLGKLIMSVGIAIFGMSPFGWRCMGTLFGVIMLPLFYLFLKKLLGKTRYATIGTLLFALDFMHFSLTRMGTIDSYPVFFIILMYFFMYKFMIRALSLSREHSGDLFADRKRVLSILIPLGLSGVAFGLGAACKWISVYAGFGLAALFLFTLVKMLMNLDEKYRSEAASKNVIIILLWCVAFFIIIPLCIYVASYIPIALVKDANGNYVYGNGSPLKAMLKNQKYMFNYHTGGGKEHHYASKWYQWPTIHRPLWAYQAPEPDTGNIGCISIMGNPFIWWSAIAGFFYSLYKGIKKKSYVILFLTIGLASQYLPWTFIRRSTFIYHFFASVPFMIMFLVYAIRELETRFPKFKYATAAFLAACAVLFVLFYPVMSGVEVTRGYASALKWLDGWVFFN